jgi:hypothetical protein
MNELVRTLQSQIAELERDNTRLRNMLGGISVNGTACACCESLRLSAQAIIDGWDPSVETREAWAKRQRNSQSQKERLL